jgi:hypothetical protein
MAVYDLADPAAPREIGFLPVDGFGLHRIWWTGGRWAYASALLRGYSDYILVTIDLADPARPRLAGRWGLPGMHLDGGERPDWPADRRYALHHAIVLARRRPHRPRRVRPGQPAPAGPPQLVAPLRRRHPHRPAPAEP